MLCCLCLSEVYNTISIFEEEGKKLNIVEILHKHFWFKIEDILSAYICTQCWDKINDFHVFYKTVEKSYNDYQNLHPKMDDIKEEDDYLNENTIKQEELEEEDYINVHSELQLDDVQVQIDESSSQRILNPLAENEIDCGENVESDKEFDAFDDEHIDDSDESFELTEKHTNSKGRKDKHLTISQKPKTKKLSKKCRRKKVVTKVEPKRKKAPFNRLDPLHTEEMIKKHIQMGCNLCVFVGKSFPDIVAHFKAEHPSTRAYITCCDKKFTKRFYVAQHAMAHENPDCFSCNLCCKSFTTTGGLQKHNLKYHAPDEELTFACDICPQKFARQYLLQLHKPSHIPREEWNFFCTKCPTSKAFASAYLLNIHDNKLHKREKNICNVCAKQIKDKKSFEKHVRQHSEGSGPRVKCPFENCDSWLKDKDNLKLHLRRHNTDGVTYKCPLCDKICSNRRALSSHKVYVHRKEVLKCEECDKTFKRAINLKEHMTQHTGEILYSCPFCTRTFNSNANMHSHKKKQHPVEWEALRRRKMCNNSGETL